MPGCSSPPVTSASSKNRVANSRVVGELVLDFLQGDLPVQLQIDTATRPARPRLGVVGQNAKPWIMCHRGRQGPPPPGRAVDITAGRGARV